MAIPGAEQHNPYAQQARSSNPYAGSIEASAQVAQQNGLSAAHELRGLREYVPPGAAGSGHDLRAD